MRLLALSAIALACSCAFLLGRRAVLVPGPSARRALGSPACDADIVSAVPTSAAATVTAAGRNGESDAGACAGHPVVRMCTRASLG